MTSHGISGVISHEISVFHNISAEIEANIARDISAKTSLQISGLMSHEIFSSETKADVS